jgi:regulator of extracellular matrix RemA (YlzA/DUF370 family)
MDTHGFIMDTTYTAETTAWIHMDTSWILYTQQQQQHGYIMDTTYTAASTACIHVDISWILHT